MKDYLKRGNLILIFLLVLSIASTASINLNEKVNENGNLKTTISINLDKVENYSYLLKYKISDLNNKIELQLEETLILEKNNNLEKEFSLVSIKPGKYKFIVEVFIYNELVYTNEKEFEIVPEPIQEKVAKQKPYTLVGYVLFILIAILVIVVIIKQKNKLKKIRVNPKDIKDIAKKEETKARIDKKLNVLKEAYKSKLISKRSYDEDNKKLRNIIKKS